MSEWKEYSLGEIYTISSGLSKPRSEFGFGYPFLSFKEIYANRKVPEKLTELVNSSEMDKERCSIKRGDVFLLRTSENVEELGLSSVSLSNYEDATFNGFAKRLRPKKTDWRKMRRSTSSQRAKTVTGSITSPALPSPRREPFWHGAKPANADRTGTTSTSCFVARRTTD